MTDNNTIINQNTLEIETIKKNMLNDAVREENYMNKVNDNVERLRFLVEAINEKQAKFQIDYNTDIMGKKIENVKAVASGKVNAVREGAANAHPSEGVWGGRKKRRKSRRRKRNRKKSTRRRKRKTKRKKRRSKRRRRK